MTTLKELSTQMTKLRWQIETVLSVSKYREYEDLSGLDDYKEIRTADDRQMLEEYKNVIYKLDEIQSTLEYLERPVKEVSRLHMNGLNRYETDNMHQYMCGSLIEFMRTEEICGERIEEAHIWTVSRVEHNGQYYIVGYPDVDLYGLKVRVR